MTRPTKMETTFKICRDLSERSPCTRRKCGAVLVKNDAIISTGYNGSCRGSLNCGEDTPCLKDLHNEVPLLSYAHCPAIHGETNCIVNAARNGESTIGSTLFLYSSLETDNARPCMGCRRFMIQAGIKDCYFMNGKGEVTHEEVQDWIAMENKWMRDESIPEVNSEIISGSNK